MSYTYTQHGAPADAKADFAPSHARRSAKPKAVRAWMILAPIAGLVLIGGAAVMLMTSGGDEAGPLVEPAAAPVAMTQPAPVIP